MAFLPFLLLLFLLLQEPISISPKSLILPLKFQKISSGSFSRSRNKLLFHHNISLTISVSVGTPPRNVSLVLDTGSELSWLRCGRNLTSFNPSLSSSYTPISCSSETCKTETRDFPIPTSCTTPSNLCHVTLSYTDMSSSEGTLAADTFRIGNASVPGTIFGCMDSSFSSNPDEDSKNMGLLGMNRGALSFVSQTGFPKFSYCISGRDSSGVLIFGDSNLTFMAALNYTPLIQISNPLPYFDRVAYSVQLEGIRVKGKILPIPASIFVPDHTGAGQTMVDSGTQFTFLLGPVYTALRNEFLQQTRGFLRVLDGYVFGGGLDLCFGGAISEEVIRNVPEVVLVFQGAEVAVSGDGVVCRVAEGVFCLAFGNSDLVGMEAYVIGHHQQVDTWVEYDLEKNRVGFGKGRCDWVVENLGRKI